MNKYPRQKIEWTEEMLTRLRFNFPYAYNKYLALDLGVSVRTLIRKAREMGIDKEPSFLEKRRMEISRMAQAYAPPQPTKGVKGWSVPNSKATRFKKGNVPAIVTSPEVREKVRKSRLQLIEDERYRMANGLDRQTKLKLKL